VEGLAQKYLMERHRIYFFLITVISKKEGTLFIKIKCYTACLAVLFIALIQLNLHAAPHWGETFELAQPDGSLVKVRVWGDEYYQRVESLDGYTLIRNKENWICYAKLTVNNSDFIATDVVYDGFPNKSISTLLNIPKGIKLKPEIRQAKADAMLRSLEVDEEGVRLIRSGAPTRTRDVVGEIKGLTMLVDFSDKPANIPSGEVNNLINATGYTGYNNYSSVKDYFYDVSNKKLIYTNYVTPYYRAKYTKFSYEHPDSTGKAIELVLEALNNLETQGFDFSTLTINNGTVVAVNLYYAGTPNSGWASGLWPHAGSISFNADGVSVKRYQITNLGNTLNVGAFCHENGHMLCGWPDVYDHDLDSKGLGFYCVMATGFGLNTLPPNPYFRQLCGWETVTDITNFAAGTLLKHCANSIASYIYKNPSNADEVFYIEARVKKQRNLKLPDAGVAVWHVDAKGSNSYQDMTASRHYKVAIEQADSLCELEKNVNEGGPNDLFHKGYNNKFNDNSLPDAHWWSGSNSGLNLTVVSAVQDTMLIMLGDFSMALLSPVKSAVYYTGDSIKITWYTNVGTIPKVKLQLSTDSGQTFTPIIASVANTDTYTWPAPDIESNKCIIALSDIDDNLMVTSEVFAIRRLPMIAIDPDTYYVKVKKGETKDDTLKLTNTGKGKLDFSITAKKSSAEKRSLNQLNNALYYETASDGSINESYSGSISSDGVPGDWIKITPSQGTVDSSSVLNIKVTFDATNLNLGKFYDTIIITHNARNIASPIKIGCEIGVSETSLLPVNAISANSIIINKSGLIICNEKQEHVSISGYDIHGKKIFYYRFPPSNTWIRFNGINSLANGTYILRIWIGSVIINRKIIVNR